MPIAARVIVADRSGVCMLRELELPDAGPGQVLVQIDAATVEPAQLHQVIAGSDGLVLVGYAASGLVLAVGADVVGLTAGDRCIVTPAAPAGGGEPIRERIALEHGEETEPAELYTWATDALVDARHVVKVPRLADKEALASLGSSTLLAATAVAAAGISSGDAIAVFGAGPVGLAIVALARRAGATTIVAIDRGEKRRAIATQLGATVVVAQGGDAGLAQVRAATEGGVTVAFDCVYEFAAKARPGAGALRRDGRAFAVGIPGSDEERAKLGAVAASFTGVVDAPDRALLEGVIELFASGALSASALVTSRYTIEGVNEAVRDLENGVMVGGALLVMEPLR